MTFSTPFLTFLFFSISTTLVLGITSDLPAQSQPGSTLQKCLDVVFTDESLRSYPQDFDYSAKVNPYNLDYPVRPAAIVRPITVEQVSAAVQCAAKTGVKVQPRSGGHSYANYGLGGEDGSLVVDLVYFQKFEMDTTTWKATIGAGTLLADVTKRLHDAGGRAIAHGTSPQIGIGGHATIGGLGPTSRQWGTTLDHIREVEVVLANGTVSRANENQYPDLYFAIRGAAASFGIVTEFVFQTHPEPASTIQYSYTFELGDHGALAKTFARWQSVISIPDLDRKLATTVTITPAGMIISGTYFGTRAEYNALNLEAQMASGSLIEIHVDDWLGTVFNSAQEKVIDLAGGIPVAFYSKSLTFTPKTLIPAAGIDALFKYMQDANKGTLLWFVIFDLEGGAINDVPFDASSYVHRDTLFYIQTYAVSESGKVSQTTRDFLDGINDTIIQAMPGVDFGAYPGYVDKYLPNGQHEYWGSNYPRLQQIKAKLDPQEVFWNPQSVRLPSA